MNIKDLNELSDEEFEKLLKEFISDVLLKVNKKCKK